MAAQRNQFKWVKRAYHEYAQGRQTLLQLSRRYRCSARTLRRHFDKRTFSMPYPPASGEAVALTLDATFFGQGYGLLVYRALGKNIYWQEITSETLAVIEEGLRHLQAQGWQFKSVTIDGRRGVIRLLESLFAGVAIQMCLYHQKAIITRYTTTRPQSECGKALRALSNDLLLLPEVDFLGRLDDLRQRYDSFLKERNEQGQFMHRKLRAALRSLKTNAPYLFTSKRFPELVVPTTTNSCDGSFAHWKARVKLHRGLKLHRRSQLIHYLLHLP